MLSLAVAVRRPDWNLKYHIFKLRRPNKSPGEVVWLGFILLYIRSWSCATVSSNQLIGASSSGPTIYQVFRLKLFLYSYLNFLRIAAAEICSQINLKVLFVLFLPAGSIETKLARGCAIIVECMRMPGD